MPEELTATPQQLFFIADNIVNGTELWVSDGTVGGTRMVRDIFRGPASSDPQELTALIPRSDRFNDPQNSVVYFRADDGSNGVELWESNGTESGTKMLKDIWIGGSSAPREFTPMGQSMFFVATDGEWGSELWVIRNDFANRVFDIRPGKEGSSPHGLVVWKNKLYFRADDGIHGEELWVSGGYEVGTQMVKDITDIPVGTSSLELVPFKDGLYFALNSGRKGQELWRLSDDGKTISLFKDIAKN